MKQKRGKHQNCFQSNKKEILSCLYLEMRLMIWLSNAVPFQQLEITEQNRGTSGHKQKNTAEAMKDQINHYNWVLWLSKTNFRRIGMNIDIVHI